MTNRKRTPKTVVMDAAGKASGSIRNAPQSDSPAKNDSGPSEPTVTLLEDLPVSQALEDLRMAATYEAFRLRTKAKRGTSLSPAEVKAIKDLSDALKTVRAEENAIKKEDLLANLTPEQKLLAMKQVLETQLSLLPPEERASYLEDLQVKLLGGPSNG